MAEIDRERLKRVVDRIAGLPTLPVMLSNINRLMMNPRTSAKEVGQLISSDPAITSKILRVVNSSFYGFPNRITTITHAIVILGFNTIKSIVLSSSIFDTFKGDGVERRFNRMEFWKHSIGVGAVAKVLGRRRGYTATEEFFIAGLLHDVGKIIIDQYLHDEFIEILDRVNTREILMLQAEEEVIGVNHAELAGWLFEKWNLSKGLVECIATHHNPSLAKELPEYAAVIHLADIIARTMGLGSGGDRKVPVLSKHAWDLLEIPVGKLESIIDEADEEVERAMVFMEFAK